MRAGLTQLNIKNGEGKEGIWTIDMKKDGDVSILSSLVKRAQTDH